MSPEEMRARITKITRGFPWLVYEIHGKIAGYAYAGTWVDVGFWELKLE